MSNLIEVEIENRSYLELHDLDKSSKEILRLTTLVDNQPGVIIKIFLNKDGSRIPLKEFEVRHLSPKVSGLPRFELRSSYDNKRLFLELKVDGIKTDDFEIKLAPYLRNKNLPLFIIIGITAALLIILGGIWLVKNIIFVNSDIRTQTTTTTSDVTKPTPESTGSTQKANPSESEKTPEVTLPVEKTTSEQSDDNPAARDSNLQVENTEPTEKTEKTAPLSVVEAPIETSGETHTVREAKVLERTVFFSPNNTDIQKEAVLILIELAVVLRDNTNAVVEISGHCALSGTEAGREELSRERAYNVVAYLKEEGWSPEIEPVVLWFGGTQPVSSEENEIYRNRRVEIRIEIP